MYYRTRLEDDGEGGFIATFKDVPEAITGGKTREAALANARDALETVLLHFADEGVEFPQPKVRGGIPVHVSPHALCKIAVLEAFREAETSKTELANRLGKGEAEARRILDPFHATKLATLEKAINALGKRFVVSVEAA